MIETKQCDLYFLKKLQDAINCLDEVDKMIETTGERQSNKDLEESDYLHLLEDLDDNTPDDIYVRIGKEISKTRKERRHLKNEFLLIQEYKPIKNRMPSSDNRQFVTTTINKRLRELNQPYKYRVLTDEKIKEILSNEQIKVPVKRTRPKVKESAELNEKIWELHKQGLSQTAIARKVFISQPSVAVRLKKIKRGKEGNNEL